MLNLQPTAELRCYGSEQIQAIWPVAKPLIQKALDRGSIYSIDEIYMGLRRKEMQLWMWAHKAALVTSIQNIDGKTFCLLLTLAGESMSQWFQYLPLVEDWAREQGAQEMQVYGRIGWARLTGYDIEYTKMVKIL
jgi:hypothetical protein